MKAIFKKLWDETARVERVIFLAGALAAGDAMPDDLDEFFDDEDVETIGKCLGSVPEWIDLDAYGHGRAESIFEWLHDGGKLGFLVKFATPVMTPTGENSRSFSWGYYSTTWVYAETLDDAIDKGLAWVNDRRLGEDAKAAKEGGAA